MSSGLMRYGVSAWLQDLKGAAEDVEVVHVEAAPEGGLKRVEKAVERDIQALGLHAVHIGIDLGDARLEGGVEGLQARLGVAILNHLLSQLLKLDEADATAVLELQLEAAGDTQALNCGGREGEDDRLLNRGELRPEPGQDRRLGDVLGGAFGVRFATSHRKLRYSEAIVASSTELPPIMTQVSTPGVCSSICSTFCTTRRVRTCEAASGSCTPMIAVALVFGRQEARRQAGEPPAGQGDEADKDQHHQRRDADEPADDRGVNPFETIVDGVEAPIERILPALAGPEHTWRTQQA